MIRTDIKNLEEIAPIIPDDVIDIYKAKYPKKDGENVKRPNITNGLTEIVINKPNPPLTVSAVVVPENSVKNHGVEVIEIIEEM